MNNTQILLEGERLAAKLDESYETLLAAAIVSASKDGICKDAVVMRMEQLYRTAAMNRNLQELGYDSHK